MEKMAMRVTLFVAIQAVYGQGTRLGGVAGKLIKQTPLGYEGDGSGGTMDYMMFVANKAMPSLAKEAVSLVDSDPPRRTNLRFKHASVQEVMANFNNSLVSNCPVRVFNRGRCTANSTYSDIHVFEDRMVDALTVVLANNKQRKIVVSYRATITTQNWLDDFNGTPVDLPGAPDGVRVHRGIYLNYLATYHKVRRALNKMLDNPRFKEYSVLVTGYSLGGAASTIAVSDLTKLVRSRPNPRLVELITYAAPRAGNPEYAKYLASFNIPVTRVTLAYDLVSHVPPRSMKFTHAGQEIHTIQPGRTGKYSIKVCSQAYDEDPKCAWAESSQVTPTRHITPFGASFPIPPYS